MNPNWQANSWSIPQNITFQLKPAWYLFCGLNLNMSFVYMWRQYNVSPGALKNVNWTELFIYFQGCLSLCLVKRCHRVTLWEMKNYIFLLLLHNCTIVFKSDFYSTVLAEWILCRHIYSPLPFSPNARAGGTIIFRFSPGHMSIIPMSRPLMTCPTPNTNHWGCPVLSDRLKQKWTHFHTGRKARLQTTTPSPNTHLLINMHVTV